MKYEAAVRPRIDDFNRNGRISMESILQMTGIAGQFHSASIDDGIVGRADNEAAWILIEWNFKIIKRPVEDVEYKVTTWVRGTAGKSASMVIRENVMTDDKGEICILASSKFVLVDLKSGKIVRIPQEIMSAYQPEEEAVFDAPAKKVRMPDVCDYEKDIFKRREDIDFNGHVHNTKYLEYALEALPHEIYEKDNITYVHIEYRNPVMEEDSIKSRVVRDASGAYIIGIYNQKEILCSVIKLKTE